MRLPALALLLALAACSGDDPKAEQAPARTSGEAPEATVTVTETAEPPDVTLAEACSQWRTIRRHLGGDGDEEFPFADQLADLAESFEDGSKERRIMLMVAGAMYREGLEGESTSGGTTALDRWLDAREAARYAADLMNGLCR